MELKKTDIEKLKTKLTGGGYIFKNESESKFEFEQTKIFLSTFDRIGLKGCDIKNSDFTQCVFMDCYARKGIFTNVNFTGSTFVNCNFHGAAFKSCTFKYCNFQNTDIPDVEIENCLPTEFNLRNDLCRNLKVNYSSLGNKKSSDKYLILELEASRKEMYSIFWGETEYYREKYNVIERFKSFAGWIKLHLDRFFYGHGIHVWMLLISYLVISCVLSLVAIIWDAEFIANNSSEAFNPNFAEIWLAVLGESIKYSFLEIDPFDSFGKLIMYISRLIGLLYLGLLTATIYRRIAR